MTLEKLRSEHERMVAQYEAGRDNLNQLLGGLLYLKKLIAEEEAENAGQA